METNKKPISGQVNCKYKLCGGEGRLPVATALPHNKGFRTRDQEQHLFLPTLIILASLFYVFIKYKLFALMKI